MTITKKEAALYWRVREILESAKAGVARTVNSTQVVADWLIGREIVEAFQAGQARAEYGRKLLGGLSERLCAEFGRGYSVDNLEAFRLFFLAYPGLISEAPSRISLPAPRGKCEAASGVDTRARQDSRLNNRPGPK